MVECVPFISDTESPLDLIDPLQSAKKGTCVT